MSNRAWIVRITDREELCFDRGIVAIGWAHVRDVCASDITWESFKKRIQYAYPEYESPQVLGQVAGSLWRFVRDIGEGDLIVSPTWTGLHIGRITGSVVYDEELVEQDSAWHYPVEWLRQEVSRDAASAPLQARCSSQQTCVEATEFVAEIDRLTREEGKPNLDVALERSEAIDAIGSVLDYHLTPSDLELLVEKLAASNGAKVERPAKNARNKKGDVDVVARLAFPEVAIGFQVKKHSDGSMTDEYAVRQIVEAMEDDELGLDIGCVVTTAGEFTDEAKRLAASAPRGPIRLLARHDLTRWLLAAGVSTLQ